MDSSRFVALFAAVVVVAGAASGVGVAQQADDDAWADTLYERLSGQVDTFNENVDDADLGVAGDQLAGHWVNLYVSDGNSTVVVSFYMDENNHISDVQRGAHPDATLKMTTDRETVESVLAAERPASAFRQAVVDGEVVIGGEQGKVVQQAKWTVINAVKGLFL